MKFNEIVDEIKKITDIRVLSSMSEKDITKIKLWDYDSEHVMDSVLYFGYDRQPTRWPEHYILAADPADEKWRTLLDTAEDEPGENAAEGERENSYVNLAIFSEEDFPNVINHIQDILAERTHGDYKRYLMELIDKVQSVDALIDSASENFNASLVLIDRDYRILSYSTKVPVTDELWVDNIKKGYCDYEFITEVKKLKSVQAAESGITPFEVTCSASPFRKLACHVYCKDSWIGSLLLIEGDQTYRAEHAEMLQMLSSVTGYALLTYSPELLSRTSDYQKFLYELLIGTPIDKLPEPYRTMKFQENMRLLYFRPQSVEALPIKSMDLQEAFSREIQDCHVIAYRNAMIVISVQQDPENIERLLTLFPSEYEVKVGISKSFNRADSLHDALEEARDALAVGNELSREGRIFTFEEFSTHIMLKHLSETEDIERYLHPAVSFLLGYDKKYGAKMLSTLRTFLDNNCNIKETAEALDMHRNSVIYRLHKMEEISGLELTDVKTRFALRLSFEILELRKE